MNQRLTDPPPLTLRVIWLAFLAAPAIYMVVIRQVVAGRESPPLPMPLTAVLALAAVATAAAGFFLPDLVARQRRAAIPDDPPLAVYQTAMIVRWACFEAVAIYGFVMAITSLRMLPVVVAGVIALALVLSSPPRPPRHDEHEIINEKH